MADYQHLDIDGIPVTFMWDNSKSIRIRIEGDGTVVAKAGRRHSVDEVNRFLHSKVDWMRRGRETMLKRFEPRIVSARDGDVIRVWEQELVFSIEPMDSHSRGTHCQVYERDGQLVMRCNTQIDGADEESCEKRKRYVQSWLRSQFEDEANRLLPIIETHVGQKASKIRFRTMKTRWGTCNTKTRVITLNPTLIHYPVSCLEYLITHELCHLYVRPHNASFYALLDKYCPNWREAELELNGKVPRPVPSR